MASSETERAAIQTAVLRGQELLKNGQLQEAQHVLRNALTNDAADQPALVLLGLAYFRAGQFEPARAIYEQLTTQTPTDASHRLNLGLTYLKLGDAARAVEALETSRALDPSQGRAVRYLGLAYARAGLYSHAYRAFLLAGQPELANEIAPNLSKSERDAILGQLGRVGATDQIGDASMPLANSPVTPSAGNAAAASAATRVSQPVPTDSEPSRSSSQSGRSVPSGGSTRSRISAALRVASPIVVEAPASVRGASGAPPIPLSQLATDALVNPHDSAEIFETSSNGTLVIHVVDRVYTRLDGVHVTAGDLAFTAAQRRARGRQTTDDFDSGGSQLHAVSGRGWLIATPGRHVFTAVTLDDDILYLREDLVFAFQAQLRWENGFLPGLRGELPLVQFRGDGAVAIRIARPLMRIKLPAHDVVHVDTANFAGWIGRVIPRAVSGAPGRRNSGIAGARIECAGEGIILVEPAQPNASDPARGGVHSN